MNRAADASEYLCPRDGHTLRKVEDHFVCDECQGVLARGQNVRELHPLLARIEASRDEALASDEHGTGVGGCAVCRESAHALSFFEVAIDWCGHCGAIWLDGNEIDQLRAQVERYKDLVRDDAIDPYRTSASVTARMIVLGQVTCEHCHRTISVRDSVYSSVGLLCISCSSERNGELPSRETAAEVDAWLDADSARRNPLNWGRTTEDERKRERDAFRADPIGQWILWWKSLLGIRQ